MLMKMNQFFSPNYERIEGKNGWVEKLKEENAEQENSWIFFCQLINAWVNLQNNKRMW